MKTTAIAPEFKKVMTVVAPVEKKAENLIVRSQEQREEAAGFVKYCRDLKDRIEEKLRPTANKLRAYATYKALAETESTCYGPLDAAIKVATDKIKKFNTSLTIRTLNRIEEKQAVAQDTAEKEIKKLEVKAEKALEKGDTNKAEALLEQAQTHKAAIVITPPVDLKKLVWKARVTDMKKLATAISAGLVPSSVIQTVPSELGAFAKNYDGKTKIGGLEFYQEAQTRIV